MSNQESSLPNSPARGGGDIGVGVGAMEVGARRGFAARRLLDGTQRTACISNVRRHCVHAGASGLGGSGKAGAAGAGGPVIAFGTVLAFLSGRLCTTRQPGFACGTGSSGSGGASGGGASMA